MKKEFKKFSKLADKFGVKKNLKNIKNLKVDKNNILKILKQFNQAIQPPKDIKRFYTHTAGIPHVYLMIALTILFVIKSLSSFLFFIVFFSLIVYLTIKLPNFFKTVWGLKIFAFFLIIPLVLNSFLFSTDLKTKEQAVNYLKGTTWTWGGSHYWGDNRITFGKSLSSCKVENKRTGNNVLKTTHDGTMRNFTKGEFYDATTGAATGRHYYYWACIDPYGYQKQTSSSNLSNRQKSILNRQEIRLKTNGRLELYVPTKGSDPMVWHKVSKD